MASEKPHCSAFPFFRFTQTTRPRTTKSIQIDSVLSPISCCLVLKISPFTSPNVHTTNAEDYMDRRRLIGPFPPSHSRNPCRKRSTNSYLLPRFSFLRLPPAAFGLTGAGWPHRGLPVLVSLAHTVLFQLRIPCDAPWDYSTAPRHTKTVYIAAVYSPPPAPPSLV